MSAYLGNENVIEDYSLFPQASVVSEVKAEKSGYISSICTSQVGVASLLLGGGRETKESVIDLSVGIILSKKVGDRVEAGDTVATLYANDKDKLEMARDRLMASYEFSQNPVNNAELIKHIIVGE